jgi:hypothetical protein
MAYVMYHNHDPGCGGAARGSCAGNDGHGSGRESRVSDSGNDGHGSGRESRVSDQAEPQKKSLRKASCKGEGGTKLNPPKPLTNFAWITMPRFYN